MSETLIRAKGLQQQHRWRVGLRTLWRSFLGKGLQHEAFHLTLGDVSLAIFAGPAVVRSEAGCSPGRTQMYYDIGLTTSLCT